MEEIRAVAAEREERIAAQAADLKELRNQLDAAHGDNSRLEADLGHAGAERDDLRHRIEESKADAATQGEKVIRLEKVLDEERQGREQADQALSDLRIEAATLRERAAHAEELRDLLRTLQAQAGPS